MKRKSSEMMLVKYLRGGHRKRLEKEMATHSSILAWEMSWTEKPGRHMVYGI